MESEIQKEIQVKLAEQEAKLEAIYQSTEKVALLTNSDEMV